MNEGQGAGMLTAMQDHFVNQGWNVSDLDSFRMEMNAGDLGGNNGGPPVGGGGAPSGTPANNNNGGGLSQEFGNPFLQEVDEAHRPIVEPYLKKWDGNITKKFQELQAKYQPYEQLGDIESIQQALYVQQLIDSEPQQVVEALAQALGLQVGPAQGPGQNNGNNGEVEIPEEFEGLPPKAFQMLQQQQQALEAIAQMLLNNNQTAQQQQEDAELDQLLTSLKEKHGEFDEEYVISKMIAGADPDKAVQAYQNLIQNGLNKRGNPGPEFPILGGGGVTPQEGGKKVTELNRNETKNLVAQVLAASAQQSQ